MAIPHDKRETNGTCARCVRRGAIWSTCMRGYFFFDPCSSSRMFQHLLLNFWLVIERVHGEV